jgi:hypothetical protein
VPELDAAGRTVVRRAAVMKGRQLPEGRYTADYDQMLTFRRRDKAAPNQEPYLTIGFSEDRVLWRDSQALLDTFRSSNDQAARTVQWLHEIATTLHLKCFDTCASWHGCGRAERTTRF